MSRRLIVSGGGRPRELMLVGTLIVGRDPACDISETNDPLMSRRHAAFSAGARDVTVKDLGSRNGILVNGVKTAECVLDSGDVVQIGHLRVRYVEEVGPFKDAPPANGEHTRSGGLEATKILDDQTRLAATIKVSDISAKKKLQ